MRSVDSGLKTAFTTTPVSAALCVKISSTVDTSKIFYFTSHNEDLVVTGTMAGTYHSTVAYTPSSIETGVNMASTNLTVKGAFDITNGFTKQQLISGILDHARVIIFQVDFTDDPIANNMELISGYFGDMGFDGNDFSIDFVGDSSLFDQTVGRLYESGCDASLFDTRCGKTKASYKSTGAVITVTNAVTLIISTNDGSLSNISTETEWFTNGLITWTSGSNIGLSQTIKQYTYGGSVKTIKLLTPTPYAVAISDTFDIYAGCRKRFVEDCTVKFDNHKKFKGFPFIPTADQVRQSAPNRTPKNLT